MKKLRGRNQVKIVLFVLIGVITLGIGYAGITALNIAINGSGSATASQNNFKVKFTAATITAGEGSADITNDTTATFSVSGLSKKDDTATATYTVKNESNGIGADISLTIDNRNQEYFEVTKEVVNSKLLAGESTTVTITVKLIKTPIDENVSGTIIGTLTATPTANTNTQPSSSTITGYTYTTSTEQFYIGSTLPDYVTYYSSSGISNSSGEGVPEPTSIDFYDNYEDAIDGAGFNFFIRHQLVNSVIQATSLGFVVDGEVYYIDSFSIDDEEAYNSNVEFLEELFGPENCDDDGAFSCTLDDLTVGINGGIYAATSDLSVACEVVNDDYSYCMING